MSKTSRKGRFTRLNTDKEKANSPDHHRFTDVERKKTKSDLHTLGGF